MKEILKLLEEMEDYAKKNRVPIIQAEGGRLLTDAICASQPGSVLEIGTAIGYSTLLMAINLPVNATLVSIEQDILRVNTSRKFLARSGMNERIEILCGDAEEILPTLSRKFDMVFIDGAKGHYLDYLLKIMDKLLPGATIVADNILFRGWIENNSPPRRYRTIVKRLQAYLSFVTTDPRFSTTIHRVGDGVAISKYQGDNNNV